MWYNGFMSDAARLADEIAELAPHLDAATHRFLTLVGRFDESEEWGQQGALTCAHWLSWRVGLELGAAREHVRVARALRALPLIDAALQRAQISNSKVRAYAKPSPAMGIHNHRNAFRHSRASPDAFTSIEAGA